MLCINTFGRVRYFPDQAKKKIQNGRTSTLISLVSKSEIDLCTRGYKTSFMLNLAENGIQAAHKY